MQCYSGEEEVGEGGENGRESGEEGGGERIKFARHKIHA